MQQPVDYCVCGINTSSESIRIRSYLLSCRILIHLFYAKCKSDKTRELSDLKFIPQTQECIVCCMTFPDFILFLEELFLIFNQMLIIRAFGRRVRVFINLNIFDYIYLVLKRTVLLRLHNNISEKV